MSDDDDDSEYMSESEAIEFARSMASRDLRETADRITFVGYFKQFSDYCFFELVHEPEGWTVSFRPLTNAERQADEQITDATILQVALSGNMISAIKLYRCKYEAGLTEGKRGVEQMLDAHFNPPA